MKAIASFLLWKKWYNQTKPVSSIKMSDAQVMPTKVVPLVAEMPILLPLLLTI